MKNALFLGLLGAAFVASLSAPAAAYLGPGSGLMGVAVLVSVIAAVVVAFVGFLWFPVRRLLRSRRGATQSSGRDSDDET